MASNDEIKQLPLHEEHLAAGARFASFAGYEMPMRYGSIVEEHHTVRKGVGFFDVSHMGQVFVRGEGALAALNRLVTNDLSRLTDGHAFYTPMCNAAGGILDDLIIYRLAADEWLVCVNAARRAQDVAWMSEQIGDAASVDDESASWSQFAIQGPKARDVVHSVADEALAAMPRFGVARLRVAGADVIAARTGYTGEDGYELYVPNDAAGAVFSAVMKAGEAEGIALIGLAARDTLRLEARYLLYGSDIDESTNPLEAGLAWTVKWDKEDFIGKSALEALRASGPARRLRGFVLQERGMLRAGYPIFVDDAKVGSLTSASVAPSLDGSVIGLGYIESGYTDAEQVQVEVRGKRLSAEVTRKPFYTGSAAS